MTIWTIFTGRGDGSFVINDNIELLNDDLLLLNHVLVEAAVLLHQARQLFHLVVPLSMGVSSISLHGDVIQNFL